MDSYLIRIYRRDKDNPEGGEQLETFDAASLLEDKAENKPVTDEEREKDRKQENNAFQNAVDIHMTTIKNKLASDSELTMEEALENIPENFRGYVKKILTGGMNK